MQENSLSLLGNPQEWQRPSDLRINLSEAEILTLEKKGLLIRLNEQAKEVFDSCFPHATTRRYVAILLGKGAAYGTVSIVALTTLGVVSYKIGEAIIGMDTQGNFLSYSATTLVGSIILLLGAAVGKTVIVSSFWIREKCIIKYQKWAAEEQENLLALPETNSAEQNLHPDEGTGKKIVHSIKNGINQLLPHGSVRRFTAIQMRNAAIIVLALTIIGAIGQPIGKAIGLDNYAVQALAGGAILVGGSITAGLVLMCVGVCICGIGGCIVECREEHQKWLNEERAKLIT